MAGAHRRRDRGRRRIVGGVLGLLALTGIARAQVVPLGPELQVNTYTTEDQGLLGFGVATDAAGNVVIVWDSDPILGGAVGIRGQRYDAAGSPVGGEFQINSLTSGGVYDPRVASDAAGNFVVVWDGYLSAGTDTSSASIQARRYDSTGTPLGAEFQVNTYTTGYQRHPGVACDTTGNVVVVWGSAGSAGSDTSGSSVQAQRFDNTGAPVGSEFQVNTYTTSFQDSAEVAINAAGDFLVVWRSAGSAGTDNSISSVQGQRFDSSGTPLGGEFQVNTYTTSGQGDPNVAVDVTGNFAVVWDGDGSGETSGVHGQRYDPAGTALGSEFQVNSYTTGSQGSPDAAADPTGNFVVIWNDSGGVGSDTYESIQGQRFDSTGAPLGSQFQVNTYTTGDQGGNPQVAPDPAGNFIVVWRSEGSGGSDTNGTSIQAQREGPARILGKKLIVRDPTGAENRRTVVALGRESATDMGPLILGDPTVSGATLRLVTMGTSPSDQTYALDAAGWQPLGAYGYLYRGPTGGDGDPVQRVRIKRTPRRVGLLQVMLRGGLGTQSLDVVPPNLGDEGALALTITGGGTYCVGFGGAAGGSEVDDSATRWKIIDATGQTCP